MDEVFGRRNFIGDISWQKRTSPANDALYFSKDHDHTIIFAKSKADWRPNRLPHSEAQASNYRNPDNDPRGAWNSAAYTCAKSIEERPNLYYPITQPNTGEAILPKKTRVWAYGPEAHAKHVAENMIYWGKDGLSRSPRIKKFLRDPKPVVPRSIWLNSDVGHNQEARNETLALFGETPFTTPKPERLIQRILHIATNSGDLVLDSFLGSGTTAAVAHKMGRRWIGVEMGDHARTHCALRLRKVIEGEQGGISRDVGWQGGGGFRFCTLGATVFDGAGRINPEIRFADLARHLWFTEFRVPMAAPAAGPFLGAHDGRGLALLYNGILRDRTPGGGNVLTHAVLRLIREGAQAAGWDGPITVYGAANRLSERTLEGAGVSFRQTPYDIRARV